MFKKTLKEQKYWAKNPYYDEVKLYGIIKYNRKGRLTKTIALYPDGKNRVDRSLNIGPFAFGFSGHKLEFFKIYNKNNNDIFYHNFIYTYTIISWFNINGYLIREKIFRNHKLESDQTTIYDPNGPRCIIDSKTKEKVLDYILTPDGYKIETSDNEILKFDINLNVESYEDSTTLIEYTRDSSGNLTMIKYFNPVSSRHEITSYDYIDNIYWEDEKYNEK